MFMLTPRSLATLSALTSVLVAGCFSSHVPFEPGSTRLEVTGSIASAVLGEDCPSDAAGDTDRACLVDEYCGVCQPSSMQLGLAAGTNPAVVSIVLRSVRLLDAATGEVLEELVTHEARVWNGTFYGPWDGRLEPAAAIQVSYGLGSPDWTRIGGGEPWRTFGMAFRIEVVLDVVEAGGDRHTLRSAELHRDPMVDT